MNQSLSYEYTQVMPQVVQVGLLVSLCTIQQRATTGTEPVTNSVGQVDLSGADYTNVPGLMNIPCMLAVLRPFRADITAVVRRPEQWDTLADKLVTLNGYYPAILQRHLAVVDGITYEIMAVESDSQQQVTRLAVRLYSL